MSEYFDKSFVKMSLGFLFIIGLSIVILLIVQSTQAPTQIPDTPASVNLSQ